MSENMCKILDSIAIDNIDYLLVKLPDDSRQTMKVVPAIYRSTIINDDHLYCKGISLINALSNLLDVQLPYIRCLGEDHSKDPIAIASWGHFKIIAERLGITKFAVITKIEQSNLPDSAKSAIVTFLKKNYDSEELTDFNHISKFFDILTVYSSISMGLIRLY